MPKWFKNFKINLHSILQKNTIYLVMVILAGFILEKLSIYSEFQILFDQTFIH